MLGGSVLGEMGRKAKAGVEERKSSSERVEREKRSEEGITKAREKAVRGLNMERGGGKKERRWEQSKKAEGEEVVGG
jgi:hypothetical protein